MSFSTEKIFARAFSTMLGSSHSSSRPIGNLLSREEGVVTASVDTSQRNDVEQDGSPTPFSARFKRFHLKTELYHAPLQMNGIERDLLPSSSSVTTLANRESFRGLSERGGPEELASRHSFPRVGARRDEREYSTSLSRNEVRSGTLSHQFLPSVDPYNLESNDGEEDDFSKPFSERFRCLRLNAEYGGTEIFSLNRLSTNRHIASSGQLEYRFLSPDHVTDSGSDDETDADHLGDPSFSQTEILSTLISGVSSELAFGMIQFPTKDLNLPRVRDQFDVFIHRPSTFVFDWHYDRGGIYPSKSLNIMLLVKEGVPRTEKKYFGIFKQYRPQIQACDKRIGFAAYMNGINVSEGEFKGYGKAIFYERTNKQIPIIGLYNPTHGVLLDLATVGIEKLSHHLANLVNSSIQVMECFLNTVAIHFSVTKDVEPKPFFLFIVHSEGGFILFRALKGLQRPIKKFITSRLYIVTLGSLRPIPNKYGVRVVNIYSKKDHATLCYMKEYKHNHNYNIQKIDCISDTDQKIAGFIDHSFLGATYQKALEDQINQLKTSIGIGN